MHNNCNIRTHEQNIQHHTNPGEDLDAAEAECEGQSEHAPQRRGGADAEHGFPFAVDGERVMAELVDEVCVNGEDEDGCHEGDAVEQGGGEAEEEAADAHFGRVVSWR